MKEKLSKIFGDRFKEQEPLAKYTNYRIGGPATFFVEVKTQDELVQAMSVAKETGVKYFVFSGGSNMLVNDEGFDGLAIKMSNRDYSIEDGIVQADAGVLSGFLARKTVDAGLVGFEWAISLPGSIGGAVRGNAGCFGGEMKDVVTEVKVLRDGDVVVLENQELQFGYRESSVKHSSDIVLSVTMRLKQTGDIDALKKKMAGVLDKRKMNQPLYGSSAGCIFKNYEIKDLKDIEKLQKDADIPDSMIENKQIAAGWIIEQLGLKGKKIGDAMISEEHGNFLINSGNATASDIAQLIAFVKTRARDTFGITLQEEVQYIGF